LLPKLFYVKVKVLGGGFGLWLGDNVAILFMVKRAHLLFLTPANPSFFSQQVKLLHLCIKKEFEDCHCNKSAMSNTSTE
jgi:hypothetical protein